jgi:MerR HTH family regulatory protein
MFDLKREQFLSKDVIRATGISNTLLQSWLSRGSIPVPGADVGSGNRRMYPGLTVVMIAVAKELADRYGISPTEASKCAFAVCRKFGEPAPWVTECDENVMIGVSFIDGRLSGHGIYTGERIFGPSYLLIRVGVIAKDVIGKLESILAERDLS